MTLLLALLLALITPTQDAVDAAITVNAEGRRQGGTVTLPAGNITLTETLKIENVHDLRVVGSGGTRLVWAGPAGDPVVRFAAASHCTLERVEITTQADSDCGVLLTNLVPAGQWITTACRLVDVSLPHTGGPGFKYGVKVDTFALGSGDANNEHHVFERLVLNNYTRSGVYINGGQAHQLRFQDCHFFDHGRRASYGIEGHYGNYWTWQGGSCSGHVAADVFCRDFTTRVTIRDVNSEHSRRFLITGGPTGAPLPISIDGVRWDGAPKDGDAVISYLSPGPLSIANASFTAQHGVPCRMLVFPPAGMAGGSLSLRNVTLGQVGGDYAPTERPVQFGAGQAVDEFGLAYRVIGREPETVAFRLRWPADLERGRIALPKLPITFAVEVKTPPVAPLADCSQGYTVSCTATVGPGGGVHPHVFALYAADGTSPYKVWWLNRSEWRLEGTGVQFSVPPAAKYRIIAWHDRETKACGLRVNGVEKIGAREYVVPVKLSLGDNPPWGLNFAGKIDDPQAWGRALSFEERGQIK